MAGGKERGTVGKEGEGEGRYFSPFLFPLSTFSPRFFFLSVSFLFFSFRKSPCYSFLFILQASVHTKEKGRGEEKVDEVELSFFFFSLSREEREKRKQGGLSLSLSLTCRRKKKRQAIGHSLVFFLSLSLFQLLLKVLLSSWRHRRASPVLQEEKEEGLAAAAARPTRAEMRTLLPTPPPPLPLLVPLLFLPTRSPSQTAASSLATPRSSRACCAPW